MEETRELILQVKNLKKYFPVDVAIFSRNSRKFVRAVDNISFNVYKCDIFALVGESGCGKTTIGMMILKLIDITDGKVIFKSRDLGNYKGKDIKRLRKEMQIIFQDPYYSLNPRKTIGYIIGDPLTTQGDENKSDIKYEIFKIMNAVGLDKGLFNRYPHELSGGQRQRVAIARALILNPDLVVCDEPVSALDVSIRSQILNLLKDLQRKFNLSYLFISHDLSVVEYISNKIAVMYLGKFVEVSDTINFFKKPIHPYSAALLSAIPLVDPKKTKNKERIILKGEIPSPINPPKGCYFNTRCIYVKDICKEKEPELKNYKDKMGRDHWCACHFSGQFV